MADFNVRNLLPEFGAEITGLEPTIPLDADTRKRLRQLFDDRGVLVFRDLKPDARFQTYLAEQLVTDEPVDVDALHVDEFHQVSNVEKISAVPIGELMFHSDTMWEVEGCLAISLYGKQVEKGAIPTLFMSAGQAYDTLPEDLRQAIEGKHAVHVVDATDQRRANVSENVLVVDFGSTTELKLPIAYRHPRTGRMLLYISPQLTHRIDGISYEESEALLERLWDHMYSQPVYSNEWREGDLVIWDNIAMQHARPDLTPTGAARTLRKTLVPCYMVGDDAPKIKVNYSRRGARA